MGEGREDVVGSAVLSASGEGGLDERARGGEVAAAVGRALAVTDAGRR